MKSSVSKHHIVIITRTGVLMCTHVFGKELEECDVSVRLLVSSNNCFKYGVTFRIKGYCHNLICPFERGHVIIDSKKLIPPSGI